MSAPQRTVREARFELADALLAARRYDDAVAELDRCGQETGPRPEPWLLAEKTADVLLGADRLDEALVALVQAVVASNGGAVTPVRRALELLAGGGLDLALDQGLVERVLAATASAPGPALLLAGMLAEASRPEQAAASLERALDAGLDPGHVRWAELHLARLLLECGRPADALGRLARLDQGAPEVNAATASALVQLGHFAEAFRVVESHPGDLDPVVTAMVFLTQGRADEALRHLTQAQAGSAEAALWRAVALLMTGQPHDAADAVDMAVSCDPSEPATLLLKAQVLVERALRDPGGSVEGRVGEARRVLREVGPHDRRRPLLDTILRVQQAARTDAVFAIVRAEVAWAWGTDDVVGIIGGIDRSTTTSAVTGVADWLQADVLGEQGADPAVRADLLSVAAISFDVDRTDPALARRLRSEAAALHDEDGTRSLSVADEELSASAEEGQAALERGRVAWQRFRDLAPADSPKWAYTVAGALELRRGQLEERNRLRSYWKGAALLEAGRWRNRDDYIRWGYLASAYDSLGRPTAATVAARAAAGCPGADDDPWLTDTMIIVATNGGDAEWARSLLAKVTDPAEAAWRGALEHYVTLAEGEPWLLPEPEPAVAFSQPWYLLSLGKHVLATRGAADARPFLEAAVQAAENSPGEAVYWASAMALLGRAGEARARIEAEQERGNIGLRASTDWGSGFMLDDERGDDGIASFIGSMPDRALGELKYLLRLDLPATKAASPTPGEAIDEMIHAVRKELDQRVRQARPWLGDLEPPDEDDWQLVARVLACGRAGVAPDVEEKDRAVAMLRDELPPSMLDPVVMGLEQDDQVTETVAGNA